MQDSNLPVFSSGSIAAMGAAARKEASVRPEILPQGSYWSDTMRCLAPPSPIPDPLDHLNVKFDLPAGSRIEADSRADSGRPREFRS